MVHGGCALQDSKHGGFRDFGVLCCPPGHHNFNPTVRTMGKDALTVQSISP